MFSNVLENEIIQCIFTYYLYDLAIIEEIIFMHFINLDFSISKFFV